MKEASGVSVSYLIEPSGVSDCSSTSDPSGVSDSALSSDYRFSDSIGASRVPKSSSEFSDSRSKLYFISNLTGRFGNYFFFWYISSISLSTSCYSLAFLSARSLCSAIFSLAFAGSKG